MSTRNQVKPSGIGAFMSMANRRPYGTQISKPQAEPQSTLQFIQNMTSVVSRFSQGCQRNECFTPYFHAEHPEVQAFLRQDPKYAVSKNGGGIGIMPR